MIDCAGSGHRKCIPKDCRIAAMRAGRGGEPTEADMALLATEYRQGDPRVQDLIWYLHRWYEGEMGSRSTMGGQLDAIERGALVSGFGPGGEPGERHVKAAERLNRVQAAWRRLSADSADTLRSAYGSRPVEHFVGLDPQNALEGYAPRHDRAELVPLLGVIMDGWLLDLEHKRWRTSLSPKDWIVKLQKEVRRRKGRECRERRILTGLVSDAERRLSEALATFGGAREGATTLPAQSEPVERHLHVERWFSPREAAAAKGVTEAAAWQAHRRGTFRHVRRKGRGRTAPVEVGDCCARAWCEGRPCEVAA